MMSMGCGLGTTPEWHVHYGFLARSRWCEESLFASRFQERSNDMFKRILRVTPIAALVAISACSNTTAPEPSVAPTQELSKQNRAVAITSPSDGSSVRYSEFTSVTWEARHVSDSYTADVSLSLDGGATYT